MVLERALEVPVALEVEQAGVFAAAIQQVARPHLGKVMLAAHLPLIRPMAEVVMRCVPQAVAVAQADLVLMQLFLAQPPPQVMVA